MDVFIRATDRFRNLSNAVPPPKVDPSACTCSGWVEKKIGASNKWRKRFCVLYQEYLYMFRNQEDSQSQNTKPTSVLSLPGTRVKEHFSPVNGSSNNNEDSLHQFEIYSDNSGTPGSGVTTEAFIGVPTKEERDKWIFAIKKVIYGLRDGGVFGKSLSDNMEYEYHHSRRLIPLVVIQTADFLDGFGLSTEGIFRHAGRAALVKELKHQYDSGEAPMLDVESVDVHSVAALLKLYFRELPEPVIPYDCYSSFLAFSKTLYHHREKGTDLRITDEIRQLIERISNLPKYSYNLLRFMCQFLFKVSQNSAENKMDSNNLATVFGPNILRCKDDNPLLSLSDSALISYLVSLMISDCDFIFKLEYNKEGNKVCTDTLISLAIEHEEQSASLLRASGYASEDDLDVHSSDEDRVPTDDVPLRRKHSAPTPIAPCFTGDMLLTQEPLLSISPDDSVRASMGIFPKPHPRRKSLGRQSVPPNHPNYTLEHIMDQNYIDTLPKPPIRNRNRKDVLKSMADVSPSESWNENSRSDSFHLTDPKIAPTPDMMYMQIASLKKEIERQRAANEGLVEGLKKQVIELQGKLATRETYYKQEIDTKDKRIKDQESKLNLLQEQVSDQQNKMQSMFEALSHKEKENIRLELDLQKMVTKLASETQVNMNLKTQLGSLQMNNSVSKDSSGNSTFFH